MTWNGWRFWRLPPVPGGWHSRLYNAAAEQAFANLLGAHKRGDDCALEPKHSVPALYPFEAARDGLAIPHPAGRALVNPRGNDSCGEKIRPHDDALVVGNEPGWLHRA